MVDLVQSLTPQQFAAIHHCRIHPGIGIARVGNSPEDPFIGPEMPGVPTPPLLGYKDAKGRIRRQAARFRIYAYDAQDNVIGELPVRRNEADTTLGCHVQWSAHLVNRKAAAPKFEAYQPSDELRNRCIHERDRLVIDPGARSIGGRAATHVVRPFNGGRFLDKEVPLGELRVDAHGRLLVLGGPGQSGAVKPGEPDAIVPTEDYANNDYWHDDVSDGPVWAEVTLTDGRQVDVDPAWVIVAPPNFAPGINSIVTLYDVVRDTAIREELMPDDPAQVEYWRDIHPILERANAMSWVNMEAQRAHGYDKPSDFVGSDGTDDPLKKVLKTGAGQANKDADGNPRKVIFGMLRKPLELVDGKVPKDGAAQDPDHIKQANAKYMPPLSGDNGDGVVGDPRTWLTLLPRQYERFRKWSEGDFVVGTKPTSTPWDKLTPQQQTAALDRAALEPCVGGAFFPGIEATYSMRWKETYRDAFRIDHNTHRPGDLTQFMAVPWQADFYECHTNWWPAQRPEDVVPEAIFEEFSTGWTAAKAKAAEGLEDRVRWDRGIGGSTLFRLPWQNPAAWGQGDPDYVTPFGREDMILYWSELGIVEPVRVGKTAEIVHIERGRRPHAGMDVRDLTHALLNIEANPECREKAREFVERVLTYARAVQRGPAAYSNLDNIRPFTYTEAAFSARMNDIYDDTTQFVRPNGAWSFDPATETNFRTREQVVERIRQLTPFNMLDGSWLRNIHRVGPVDDVNSILYSIFNEELGGGKPSENHANIWRDLCHSVGFYPPAAASSAFARDPDFMTAAFDSPAFQLAISEFSTSYYPEIIGMTLFLEWTVLVLNKPADTLDHHGIDSHFYRMHIAIDNASHGHGARIVEAIKRYMLQIRQQGGESAVQAQWARIWDGYVAFNYTFSVLIDQIKYMARQNGPKEETPLRRERRLRRYLMALIESKKPYGRHNHGALEVDGKPINSWFDKPGQFLAAMIKDGWIVPGKPEESPFFELLGFDGGKRVRKVPLPPAADGSAQHAERPFNGGRMFKVFSDRDIEVWREWTAVLAEAIEAQRTRTGRAGAAIAEESAARQRLRAEERRDQMVAFAARNDLRNIDANGIERLRKAASDYRIGIWLERAAKVQTQLRSQGAAAAVAANARATVAESRLVEGHYRRHLARMMVRALAHLAVQSPSRGCMPDIEGLLDSERQLVRTLEDWLGDIRDAPNPAIPAGKLMRAMKDSVPDRNALIARLNDKADPLRRVLAGPVPGNDGKHAWQTLVAWLEEDCPIETPTDGTTRPLSIDSTFDEEERHPTGVTLGFHTVH